MRKGKGERLLKVIDFGCFDFLRAQFNLPERSLIFRGWLIFDLLESKGIAKWWDFFFPPNWSVEVNNIRNLQPMLIHFT